MYKETDAKILTKEKTPQQTPVHLSNGCFRRVSSALAVLAADWLFCLQRRAYGLAPDIIKVRSAQLTSGYPTGGAW